jgi:hypothetical protein
LPEPDPNSKTIGIIKPGTAQKAGLGDRKEIDRGRRRPILFYPGGTICRQPRVKGLTIMVNSIYNGSRYEDLWLDN